MPDWFYVCCKRTEIPSIEKILQWTGKRNCKLKVAEDYGFKQDLFSSNWQAVGLIYKENKHPFITEIELDDGSQQCLFRQIIEELLERVKLVSQSDSKTKVIQHLTQTNCIIVNQIPYSTDKQGYSAVNIVMDYFAQYCDGMSYVNEVFYLDKIILEV
ncbi:MAG: hypothetical protein HY819_19370 [Acidobacteria bacterium]|nr:hypothetical protein [Acidobacteriota bacterium]